MAANDTVLPSESGESDQNKEDSASRTAKKYGGKKSPGAPRQTKLPSCSLPTNMIPTFYVGGGNGVALVEAPLLNLGWKRTHDKYDERFRLKWVECKSKLNYSTFKEGEQLVNHIPNANLLTNKLGLLNSLQEYERVTLSTKGRPPRLRFSDFVPETYRLDETKDREEFLRIYNEGELWICKPTGMNQGKGIFILRSKEEISKLLEEREMKKEQKTKGFRPLMTRVVQRYIDNPLLLEGRKFDIRAYMLIASTVPYLLLYHKGYVRLCCNKYNHDDTNLSTHLTNQFVQKKDPNYKEIKEDTAWSIEKFNQYINESIQPKTEGMETDWVYCSLTKQMQKIMIHCFNSVKHKLQSRLGYFDLFGLDFMVDTNLKVWLIEVNVNPALHTNCTALKEVIPGVVEETLNVVLEAFDKSKKHQPLLPLNSMKGFSVLYCGSRLNTITSTRQTRSVSPVKDSSTERRNIGTASARQPSPNRHRMTTVSTPVVSTGPVSSTVKKAEPVTVSSSGRSPISSAAPNPGSGAVKLRLMHAGDKEADNNKEKADEEKPVEGDTNNSADKNSDETAEDDKDNSNTTDSSLIEENTDNEKSEEKSVAPQKLGGTGNSNSNAIPNKNNADNKQKPTEAIKTGRSAIADAIKNSGAISNSLTAATAASAAKTQPSLHRYPARPKNQGETKPFVRSSSQVETKSTLKPSVATVKSFQEQDLKLAFSKTQETSAVAASQKNSSSQGTKVLPTLSLTTSTNGNLPTQQIKTAVITVTSSDSVEGMKLSSVQSNSAAACLMNNQTTSGKLLINDLSSSATVTFPSITGSYSGDVGTSNNQGFTGTKYLNNALNNANGTPYSARRRSKDRDRPDRGN